NPAVPPFAVRSPRSARTAGPRVRSTPPRVCQRPRLQTPGIQGSRLPEPGLPVASSLPNENGRRFRALALIIVSAALDIVSPADSRDWRALGGTWCRCQATAPLLNCSGGHMSVEASELTSEVWTRWQGHVINGVFPLGRYLGCSDHSGVFLTRSAPRASKG